MKSLMVVLSVALNAAFVGSWGYCRWSACAGAGAEAGCCPLQKKLGANAEQWQALQARRTEFRQSAETICRDLTRLQRELIELLASAGPDREAIRAKQEAILAGQRHMQDLVIDHLLAEKNHLMPAQQEALFDLIRVYCGCAGQGP